jgi:hypothetical protein
VGDDVEVHGRSVRAPQSACRAQTGPRQ